MFRCIAAAALSVMMALTLAGCGPKPSASMTADVGAADGLSEQFLGLMNAGRNSLDQGDATNALVIYGKARAMVPNDPDVHLNLANAHLAADAPQDAVREATEVLRLSPNSAAAYFVKGSAYLRLANPEEASKAFENARTIDPGEVVILFQLGKARMDLKQWTEAIAAFKEGLAMDPNHLHSSAHYLLGQALVRAGRTEEARSELEQHQAGLEAGGPAASTATFERSKYTQARVPFRLEQPDAEGVKVRFVDATQETLGAAAGDFSGPVGVIDVEHTGWNSLFALEKGQAFRLLRNSNGTFQPQGSAYPATPGARYQTTLVGDLQNDRFEDILVLGDKGSHLFSFTSNGIAADVSRQSHIDSVSATDGVLMDLDFTGKLDLVAVGAGTGDLKVFRQFGALNFKEITATTGIPAPSRGARVLMTDDWNQDGSADLIVSRDKGPPALLEKQRGGRLVSREPTNWVAGVASCTGDFDNDLRVDLAIASGNKITICYNGGATREIQVSGPSGFSRLAAFDYDNDGWLDLWGIGDTVRVWRNVGALGFREQTSQLGLDLFRGGAVSGIYFADFDKDCDSDVLLTLENGGLRYLRNDGGNAQGMVKVQLSGNRSNASGLGCKVEIEAGGLRLLRTVQRLPVEVGVGRHQTMDSFLVHWFNWPQGSAGVPVNCQEPVLALEATIQEGSCPYLYAWDGKRFRFVTDILGAAPLGLPVAEGRYIDADPEEWVRVGDETTLIPREGRYLVRITEELREVLYLDEVKLAVVERDPAVEVHPTCKLLPGPPFPRGKLLTLHHEQPLQHAGMSDGREVAAALRSVDGLRVSPPRLRIPQLRGLSEPHSLILDFGPLDARKPLVLVMNGWLRFGGGMANIAASHDPSLPFPFPSLEAEVSPGVWKGMDVTVGAPAGKTKTILLDLEGKIPTGTRRLRLTQAFEIHWDRIALMEKQPDPATRIIWVAPTVAELRFHGFGRPENLPPDWPSTPDYETADPDSRWTVIPGGWCTRYGDVRELITSRDEGLALIPSGDELSLEFDVKSLPEKPPGTVREFFLYVDGWDKDSDFHVVAGTQIGPLPFHGMDAQRYGMERRPGFASDELHRKYNTRWVEPGALKRSAKR